MLRSLATTTDSTSIDAVILASTSMIVNT